MKKKIEKRQKEAQGIALLLTVILLGTLIIITTSATSLIFALGQTVRGIGDSEKAYYAAETGIEQGLYLVEKQNVTLDALAGSGVLSTTGATWTRTAFATYKIPQNHPSVTAASPTADISDANPLLVTLNANESFQMDLNLVSTSITYSQHLRINWAGAGATKLIQSDASGQTTSSILNNQKIPAIGNIDPIANLRFRLINESGSTIQYMFSPGPSGTLPMGLVISSIGISNNQERRIEVERKAWLVF